MLPTIRKIELCKPWLKNYGVQMFKATAEDRSAFMRVLRFDETSLKAHPFFQGGSVDGDWLFIEFWTDKHDLILAAAERYALAVNLPLELGELQ